MKRNLRRTLCFSLALCLCLVLFAMAPASASAETGIGKVLIQTGNGGTTPVVWMELQYLPTNTSTAGVTITSAQWYTVLPLYRRCDVLHQRLSGHLRAGE